MYSGYFKLLSHCKKYISLYYPYINKLDFSYQYLTYKPKRLTFQWCRYNNGQNSLLIHFSIAYIVTTTY